MFTLLLTSSFWALVACYEVCRKSSYFTHNCPDNYKCCGDDGIHCCPIDHTLKYVGIGIAVGLLFLLLIFFMWYLCHARAKTRAMSKVDISHEDKISVSMVKSWDKQGAIARLEASYLHAEEQEGAAWELETLNAEDGLQKAQIELELAENRCKIATEILEKAQKAGDPSHIDQALQRKISCDHRVLKSRILWDLAMELTKRDPITLACIIDKARRKKINDDERILRWAREMLFFLQSKESLDQALIDGSYEELNNALTKVRELGFEKKSAKLVFRAMLKCDRIEMFQTLLKGVLEMNHMQMQDLVAYTDPDEDDDNPSPESLCKVLQATAEFLGGDEECWMELQSMVTRMGEGSLKRRAMGCEIEQIPGPTLLHAAQLLESVDEGVVREECSHALPLYRWCHAILEERLLMTEELRLFFPPLEEERPKSAKKKKGKKGYRKDRVAQA